MFNERDVVMSGTWVDRYQNKETIYTIVIVKGDVELPVEVYESWIVACYYIGFLEESKVEKGRIILTKSKHYFFHLEEAQKKAEEMTQQKIRWELP